MNFATKEMAQLSACKLGIKTGTVCVVCHLMKQKWTINWMKKNVYTNEDGIAPESQ